MDRLKGKTLLELGTNVGSVDIVKYAKSEGAHVIVTDYLPIEKSEAKKYADESFMISTTDIDSIVALAKEKHVDCIFSGVSEVNLESARKASDKLGKNFYCTSNQWNNFMNKSCFRDLCMKYNVNTPKTYYKGYIKNDMFCIDIKYPVIVKPVDSCANLGITVCFSKTDLEDALVYAEKESATKQIIIEQYIDGSEISSTYVIQNGVCKLVCLGEKKAYKDEKGLRSISQAFVYPSKHYDEYINKMNDNIIKMIKDEKLNNCSVFFQMMYLNNCFYVFEAGLRIEGTGTFRITNIINEENYMNLIVDNIFGIETKYNIEKENPLFNNKKCVIFSQIIKGGLITKIEGIDKFKNDSYICYYEQTHNVGDYIKNDGTLRMKIFRYVMIDEDINRIIEKIKEIQKTVRVYDEKGIDIIIKDFDPNVLLNYL